MRNMFRRFLACMLLTLMLVSAALGAQAATLTLPQGVKTIESEAFEGSAALDEVILPNGITAIGSRAFANSSLRSINLPRSITSIAADAFENSPNLRAVVKAGSYAMAYCAENGIAYDAETVVLPSAGIPISVSTSQTSVAAGEDLRLTFTADDGSALGGDTWFRYSVVYLNADNEVVRAYTRSSDELGEDVIWIVCAGAVKVVITVVDSEGACAGAYPSVEVAITGGDSYVYYDTAITGRGYPGGTLRATITALNASKMTGSKAVTLTDEAGSFEIAMGSLSASNPTLSAEFTVPREWQSYNEEGDYVEYMVDFRIGADEWQEWYVDINPFCYPWMEVPVGETWALDGSVIPSEMPYTYAIEDTSIATIDGNGYVTGVSVGKTTGTLTTKSGIVASFEVEVLNEGEGGGDAVNDPVFYIVAPQPVMLYGEDDVAFQIRSETENALLLDDYVDIRYSFYDENEELIDEFESDWYINTDDYETVWADWQWWDNRTGGGYRYVEVTIIDTDYEVIEPSSARIEVISPEEMGILGFSAENTYGMYNKGDTVTVNLTCTTPNLLAAYAAEGEVKVTALNQNEALEIIRDQQPAVFDAETQTAALTFTVGKDVVPGDSYYLPLYCGANQVGYYSLQISSGLTRLTYETTLLVGGSRKMPVLLAEGANLDNLYFYVYDPSIISIEDGVATGLAAGSTEVEVYFETKYGITDEEWMRVVVCEAAAEDVPVLTVTPLDESVAFGSTARFKLQLSGPVDAEQIRFNLHASYMDKNGAAIANWGRWQYLNPEELLGEGKEMELPVSWPNDSDLYNIAQVVYYPSYVDEVPEFELDYSYKILSVTDIPEPGVTKWMLALDESGSVSWGDWVNVEIRCIPSVSADTPISLCMEDGTEVWSGTFWGGNSGLYSGFSSDPLTMGENTLYLYVEGEKAEGVSLTFTLDEPQVKLNKSFNPRIAVNETRPLNHYYNADGYDCEVAFSVSDENVASIDENNTLKGVAPGYATVTVTCAHGKSDSYDIIVYDTISTGVPEISIAKWDNNNDQIWMSWLPYELTAEGDLSQIPYNSMTVYANLQFLDADGNVIYDLVDEEDGGRIYLHHNLRQAQVRSSWNEERYWLKAAEMNAAAIRFVLLPRQYSYENEYLIDAENNSVTYELPPLDEYEYPVVKVDCTRSIMEGADVSVTFTCLNPNALTVRREVSLYDNNNNKVTGWLTKDEPQITLSLTPEEGFTSGYYYYRYPQGSDGYSSTSFYVTVSSYDSLGRDSKFWVGDYNYFSARYSGAQPNLTFTSSDESVATVSSNGSSSCRVDGVGMGTAVITGTDENGTSHSFTVVIYDNDNIAAPTLYLDQNQSESVKWEQYAPIAVKTDDEPYTFASPSLEVSLTFLDEAGEAHDSTLVNCDAENGFVYKEDTANVYVDLSKMAAAFGEGARYVRFTLNSTNNYAVSESAASVTLPIADPSESETPVLYTVKPEYVAKGSEAEVTFVCMNPDSLGEGVTCRLFHESGNEVTSPLTKENPSVTLSVNVPEDYSSNTFYLYMYVTDAENSNLLSSYDYPSVLGGIINNTAVMSIGSTRTLSYNLNTTVDGLTPVWESANPEVATIDQTGLVTAVGAGHTEIYLHYGPATLTAGVRVYDSSITAAVPEYYMAVKPNAQAIPYQSAYFFVGVATDPAALGSYLPTCSIVLEAVDANGSAVAKISQSSYGVQYVNSNETSISRYVYPDDLARYVALGATHLRMRIVENANYTIDASRAYADLPIQDPTLWGRNTIGIGVPDLAFGGQTVTVPVKLVSCTSNVYGKTVTVKVTVTDNSGEELMPAQTLELSSAAPDGSITFDLPQGVTYAYISYSASSSSDNWSGGKDMSIAYVVQPNDEAVAIGNTCYTYLSGNNLSGLARSYESSNPEVATVDENGAVTGVSAGVTVITAHVGPMQTSFSVRVYDPNAEHAVPNLSLSAPDAEQAVPNQQVIVTVSTDTDLTTLGGGSSIDLYRQYLDAEGNAVGSPYCDTYTLTFAAKQTKDIEVYLNSDEMYAALMNGATQVRVYAENSVSYTLEPGMEGVTIPLQDPAEWGYMAIGWDVPDRVIAGREIAVNVAMLSDSPYEPGKNYTCTFYVETNSGVAVVDGETGVISAESPKASFTFTPPEGTSYLYIRYNLRAEGESYNTTSDSCSVQVITLPEVTQAETLADLQSVHDYENDMNHAWSYTVEGAVSLHVYLNSQSRTESNYDHLMIGSLSSFESGSMEYDYSGYMGGYNFSVRGDTVILWLKSDSSSTYYGFAVERIEATMADGSVVTITE